MATTTARKTTTKTPAAKKAPAKAAAAKAAPKQVATPVASSAAKLRWTVTGPVEAKGKAQSATAGDRTYDIRGGGTEWVATVKVGKGKATVLVEGTFGVAYNAVTKHNREAAPAAAA